MYSRALVNISADNQMQMLNYIRTSVDNEIRQNVLIALNIGINHEVLTLANRWHNEQEAPRRYALDMEMRSRISQPILFVGDYEAITFYFRNSDDIYSFGRVPAIPPYCARQATWYKGALQNPGRIVVDSSLRQVGNRFAMTFAINPGAIIHGNDIEVIYFSFFVDFIRDYNLNYGDVIIADRDGLIIYSTDETRMGLNLSDFPKTTDLNLSSVQTISGEEMLVSAAIVPTTNWRIIRTIPYGDITRQVGSITIYGYIAISVYVLLFALFSVLFYQKIIKSFLKLEIQTMQYQITPHFIINTLNSIKIMAMISRQEKIEKTTDSFMRLLSAVLGKTGTYSSVKEEIANIKHYIHIMKMRFEDKFEVEYEIDKSVENLVILSFLLQPIVENSIMHGINEKEFGGLIRIRSYTTDNRLIVEIEDNGVGMTEEKAKKLLEQNRKSGSGFLSMGVYNVNQRIRLNFGKRYGLSIKSRQGEYTRVICELPILTSKDALM